MELFSLDAKDQTAEIKLRVTSELVMYWIHFTSYQMHWRGQEVSENHLIDEIERNHLIHELQFFDFLYHKFLMFIPEPQALNKSNDSYLISLPLEVIEKLYFELDDFIEYCDVYHEEDLVTISKNYKSTFSSLFLDSESSVFH